MTAAQHVVRGSYRPDRHGPLPEGTRPFAKLSSVTSPPPAAPGLPVAPSKFLSLDDAPPELTSAEQAMFATIIASRPIEAIYGTATVCSYIAAWSLWRRATAAIQSGDLMKISGKPAPNPFLKMRQQAELQMRDAATALGWSASATKADMSNPAAKGEPPAPSRLMQFLEARRKQAGGRR